MAIEPLGSIMSYQAQTVQSVAPKAVEKPAAEFTEGAALNHSAVIDKTTPVVSQATEKGDQHNKQQNDNTQAQNEQIRKAVEQLNKKMNNSEAVYGIHDGTNRITIKIVDKETKETIRELPPEKTLDMIVKVWELAGMLVDEKR